MTGTMTRRTFLGLVGLGSLALAGCGQGSISSPPAKPAPPSAATKPASAAASAKSAAASPVGSGAQGSGQPSGALAPQELIDAAKKEGRLTYYSSTGPSTTEKIVSAFKARYGVEVDATRLASGPMAQRYAAEAQAGNVVADVIQVADVTFFEQAADKGWVAKLGSELPSLAQWPKDAWTGAFARVHVAPLTLLWNTSLVKEADAPQGWEDVLKPAFKGQILMVDPRAAPVLMSWALLLDKTYGDDFLKKMAAQEPRLVPSSVPGSQQLAAGAGALLVPSTHSDALTLKAQKAPVVDIFPSPTVGNESYVGVSSKAPHPNSARLLLNFLLSREGQGIFVGDGYSSVLPDLPGAEPLPKGYTTPNLKEGQANSARLMDLLGIH